MSETKDKEMSMEMRSLLALVLCLLVYVGWFAIFKPPAPPPATATAKPAEQTAPATGQTAAAISTPAPRAPKPAAPVAPISLHAATAETSLVIESDLYHVEISNRGGVVRSWQLKRFTDDHKPPLTLDLVHPQAAQASGYWPFSLVLDDPQQEVAANNALFEITSGGKAPEAGAVLRAPAEVTLKWSDGHLEVTKQLKSPDKQCPQPLPPQNGQPVPWP